MVEHNIFFKGNNEVEKRYFFWFWNKMLKKIQRKLLPFCVMGVFQR